MLLVTASDMRQADRRASEEFNIPSLLLMENAAQGAAAIARELLQGQVQGKRVIALCGMGNNGGDAVACARILANQGAEATIVLLGQADMLTGDSLANWQIAQACGLRMLELKQGLGDLLDRLQASQLIVDGLLGTGFKPPLRPPSEEAINLINLFANKIPILAMDIPSGLDADTGHAPLCVQASATAVFACLKTGLALNPFAAGEMQVVDIGLPPAALDHVARDAHLLTRQSALCLLPQRPPQGHKGTFGHVFLLGGSPGKSGAMALACSGALASGAGLVTGALPHSLQPALDARVLAAMSLGLAQTSQQGLSLQALEVLPKLPANSWVIGPGLGQEEESRQLIRQFLQQNELPVVIDADALNALSPLRAGQIKAANALLTPHPGEAARLLNTSVPQIQADRMKAALEIARLSNGVCLLKGAASVLAAADSKVLVNHTGNNLLASGGSGDILAGLAGGLMAQGLSAWQAGALAAYVHGLAADIARQTGIISGLNMEDLPQYITKAWSELC